MAILKTDTDRRLYTEIHTAVAKASENLIHQSLFNDRDGPIVDAAYRRLSPLIRSGDIPWAERGLHIARYVSGSISKEKLAMGRRAAHRAEPTELHDPLDLVADPTANVFESVACMEELRTRIAEARHVEAERLRNQALFRIRIQQFALEFPKERRQRFVSVMLCSRKVDESYQDLAEQVASLGFGRPDAALMRQWWRRYGNDYSDWFRSRCHSPQ